MSEITEEQKAQFARSIENVMNSFIEAIELHVEDEAVAEAIAGTAAMLLMRKTLEHLTEQQEKLFAEVKAKKAAKEPKVNPSAGTKDHNPPSWDDLFGSGFGKF